MEHLQPLGPTAAARDRRRGKVSRRSRGPWMAIAGAVLAILVVLAVIGLVGGGDDDGGDGNSATGDGTTETTETQARTETAPEQPAPPKRVAVRVAPANEVYVCVDSGAGTEITFNGILDAPRTFRGRRVRVNLGKTDVEVSVNGRAVAIDPGPDPVGFAFTPGKQRSLPLGERPCA